MNTKLKLIIPLGIIYGLLLSSCTTDRVPWTDMITENGLDDFEQLGGEAMYSLDDGIITGTTVANTENSFLCTRKQYGDFILEFKVLVDTSLNSGVQIRSHAYQNGRVHGYQVEIDPSTRAWSGGIYDEARRAWLNDLSENESGGSAFRNGRWNQYRIEAIGNSMKVWINGTLCANLVDDADDSGCIAFQVHSINVNAKPWTEGVHVQWKDIRILTSDLDAYQTKEEETVPAIVTLLTNRLTDTEITEGWEMLFDGESMGKWRGAHKDGFPEEGWKVEEGILKINAEGGGESANAGDIITLEKFSDFDLKLEFKLTPGANSGIKYFVTEQEKTTGSAIGLEYQLLDDDLHPDAQLGRDGNRTVASLYDLIPAGNKYIREIGMWNMARILSVDRRVEHWLNGRKVLEYERGSDEYRKLVAISKYKVWENFGEADEGHILLQEHGNDVEFRNIKIRDLSN